MEKMNEIPEGIKVEINKLEILVSSGDKKLEKDFSSPLFNGKIKIESKDNKIIVTTESDKKKIRAMVGTINAHVKNMMTGLGKEYVYKLKIAYVHFPFTVKIENNELLISNFLGEKSMRRTKILDGVKVEVKGDIITVSGIDKERVGLTAGRIEQVSKVKKRDRRTYMDGIFLISKG